MQVESQALLAIRTNIWEFAARSRRRADSIQRTHGQCGLERSQVVTSASESPDTISTENTFEGLFRGPVLGRRWFATRPPLHNVSSRPNIAAKQRLNSFWRAAVDETC